MIRRITLINLKQIFIRGETVLLLTLQSLFSSSGFFQQLTPTNSFGKRLPGALWNCWLDCRSVWEVCENRLRLLAVCLRNEAGRRDNWEGSKALALDMRAELTQPNSFSPYHPSAFVLTDRHSSYPNIKDRLPEYYCRLSLIIIPQ